jgi:hypothetical protein
MRLAVIVLVGTIGLWLALPSVASVVIERWLLQQGYEGVTVQLGRPGLRSMTVPNIALTQRLTGEVVTLSLKESRLQYTLLGLLAGHIDLIVLPDLSVEIRMAHGSSDGARSPGEEVPPDAPDSFLNVMTASDLVQRLPLLPCDELHLGQMRIFREQATGPLQTVMMTGMVKQVRGALVAEMLLQGTDTIPYELRVTGQSASEMLLQLRAAQPSAAPIVLWRSESVRKEARVHLKGVVEVNAQELAPFLALAVPIGSDWRRVSGSVTVHWAGTAPPDVPVASLWNDAGTEVQASVQVSAALPELKGFGQDIAVKMTGTLSGNARRVQWAITPGTLVTAMVNAGKVPAVHAWPELVRSRLQPLVIASAGEINGELFLTASPPRFTATGLLTVSYGSPKDPVRVELVAQQLSGYGRHIEQAEGSFHVEGNLPGAISERLGLKEAAGDFRGTVTLSGSGVRGAILPPSSATFAQFRQDPLSVARGTVQLSEPLPVIFDVATGRWGTGSAMFLLRIPQVRMADRQVTTQQATVKLEELEGSAAAWKARATAILRGVTLIQPHSQSLPADLTVRMTADPVVIKADVQAHSQDKTVTLAAQLEHTLTAGRGTVRGTLGPVIFNRAQFRLRQLLSPWSYPIDVTDGSVAVAFDATWAEDAQRHVGMQTGSAEVVIGDLAGQYGEITFAGLNTKVNVVAKGYERIATSHPVEIKIASVNTGVEVTNIALAIQGEWDLREVLPVVEGRDFSCELLGGTLTSQGVRADLAHPPYAFTLMARQLDLQKVLSLEQQKGLQGTGLLDGSIPVTVTAHGVTVKDGQLEARPPGGVIRYGASPEAAKAVTQANANMQLVLQALSNFHYNVLQVGAQYADDGMLNLKARLEGRNPDQKKSPPIHLNLTVQENIPALLKTLQLTQDIEESVRKKFVKP